MQCPVCGFPSYVCETDSLEAEVVAYLRTEVPRWCPDQGLCPRCADLYRVRAGVFGRFPASGAPNRRGRRAQLAESAHRPAIPGM